MPPKPKKNKSASSRYRKIESKPKASLRIHIPKQEFVIRDEKSEASSLRYDECDRNVQEYEKKELLGKGANGRVYQLCDADKKCPYVLKVVDLKKTTDVKQFEIEVTNQMRASKLGIAPHVLDAWICHVEKHKARGFIAMEYLDISLKKYLRLHKTEFSDQFLDQVVAQIQMSVDSLHLIGIEHGDLNENNIYYKNGRFLLIDFGLSGPRGHPKKPGRSDEKELTYLRQEILPLIMELMQIGI